MSLSLSLSLSFSLSLYVYIYISFNFIYIYIYRDRGRERERDCLDTGVVLYVCCIFSMLFLIVSQIFLLNDFNVEVASLARGTG